MIEKLLGSLLPIKIGLVAALFGGLWLWHVYDVRSAVSAALEAQQAQYSKAAGKETLRIIENQTRANQTLEKTQRAQYDKEQQTKVAGANLNADLERLRGELSSAGSCPAASIPGPVARIDGACRLERDLLGQCGQALARMAQGADGLEARIVGLQGYAAACHQATQ